METPGKSCTTLTRVSTEDILKALDSYGEKTTKIVSPTSDQSRTFNRDSGLSCSESCSSFVSDPLSVNGDVQSTLSDNEHLSDFTSDNFSVISDPLGALSASDDGEGDNDIHFFETKPWDEKQTLEREWKLLFNSETFLTELCQYAVSGKLKHSKYRSIAWKVFLDCLPEDQDQWITKTRQLRYDYKTFKQKSLIDPSKSKEEESLNVLHPLSLDDESPWKQFFKDNELRAMIKQDLDRLYPEIDFFNTSSIKEIMLNVLFCYAKKNESLGYKQGMHELLAPIVYVLELDSSSFKYTNGLNETIQYLLDPSYIENDAYAMFCQLMEVTEAWYQHHKSPFESNPNNKFLSKSEPFAAPVTTPPTAIIKKLNKIQDHLLRKHDTDLWFHLKELNIEPQVYGLRWIRLLFSREFPFQDVLVIWDALLADSRHLDLVEYIYIVMLQSIRNKLIISNYTACLSYLMKFPHINDVNVIVKRAIHLRGSKKPRQQTRTSQTRQTTPNQSHIKPVQKKPSARRPHAAFANFTKRYTAQFSEPKPSGLPPSKQNPADGLPAPIDLGDKSSKDDRSDSFSSPLARERTDSNGSGGRTMKSLGNELKTKLTRPRRVRPSVEELEKDHQRLQTQVSELNGEIDRMQGLYLYCGRKLDSYIGLLQEEVTKDAMADRDVIYLSLAGLKQVRDLLKGTLSYRGSSMETEKDFFDIDKGIASRLQISSPNIRISQSPRSNQNQASPSKEELNNSSKETYIEGKTSICNDGTAVDCQKFTSTALDDHFSAGDTVSLIVKSNHIDDQVFSNPSQKTSDDQVFSKVPPCTLANLDSYIEEHFSSPSNNLNYPTYDVPIQRSASTGLPNDFLHDLSNVSSPDENLDREFVFVDKDGTAIKSAEVSPRLTPTHPLQVDDEDENEI